MDHKGFKVTGFLPRASLMALIIVASSVPTPFDRPAFAGLSCSPDLFTAAECAKININALKSSLSEDERSQIEEARGRARNYRAQQDSGAESMEMRSEAERDRARTDELLNRPESYPGNRR